jgi:hypothetical protein
MTSAPGEQLFWIIVHIRDHGAVIVLLEKRTAPYHHNSDPFSNQTIAFWLFSQSKLSRCVGSRKKLVHKQPASLDSREERLLSRRRVILGNELEKRALHLRCLSSWPGTNGISYCFTSSIIVMSLPSICANRIDILRSPWLARERYWMILAEWALIVWSV